MAETRENAEKAFNFFIKNYQLKYRKATQYLCRKGWQKLRGFTRLADVINGVKFIDGIDEETLERQWNAA
jgi:hypothetical protein